MKIDKKDHQRNENQKETQVKKKKEKEKQLLKPAAIRTLKKKHIYKKRE